MRTFEINWSDLTEDCQEEMVRQGFWHDNVEVSPVAIIEQEEEEKTFRITYRMETLIKANCLSEAESIFEESELSELKSEFVEQVSIDELCE